MVKTLQELSEINIGYNWHQHPNVVRSVEDALAHGANCIALAHLAIGPKVLPPEMHCYEMVTDQSLFRTVSEYELLLPGDLFWFGRDVPGDVLANFKPQYDPDGWLINWDDDPVTHVAIFTGDYLADSDPLLLHASQEAGKNVVWPRTEFAKYERYKKIHRISRFIGSCLNVVREE